MSNHRENLKNIRKAIRTQFNTGFNLETAKHNILDWLNQIKFPMYSNCTDWEDCLIVHADETEQAIPPQDGFKLRFNLKLYTMHHSYLLSIIECFSTQDKKVGIITVHQNWDEKEFKIQKAIETSYQKNFQDALRAKQTIWAQTFFEDKLFEGLNSCALAILGNELKGEPQKKEVTTFKMQVPAVVNLPKKEID